MIDLEITRDASGEFMVAQIEGLTDAGIEYVDAYTRGEFTVVDAGRIVIREAAIDDVLADAGQLELNVVIL